MCGTTQTPTAGGSLCIWSYEIDGNRTGIGYRERNELNETNGCTVWDRLTIVRHGTVFGSVD
jgi:hypothetical protein